MPVRCAAGNRRRLVASLVAAAAIAAAASEALPRHGPRVSAADGTTFRVTVMYDAVDAVPGDGTCVITGGGCSLRAAVMEANARPGAAPYVVEIPTGTFEITLPGESEDDAGGGDVDVRATMVLRGAGREATVVRAPGLDVDHAFEVFWDATATFEDLTICCSTGGAIRNRLGAIELTRATLRDNRAHFGGGVANDGVMTATDVAFLNNRGGQGGGLVSFTGGSLTIRRCRIEGNGDSQGGGAKIQSRLDMSDCVVQHNAGSHGGGLNLQEAPAKVIRNTTIAHNRAGHAPRPPYLGYGGGIWSEATDVRLINVTLSDNWGQGGGIMNGGLMTVTNSTLATNGSDAWGAAIYNRGTMWVANTVIGPSLHQSSCDTSVPAPLTLGHNIDVDGSCALRGAGDRGGLDAGLDILAWYGGFGATHALLSDSPAIDAGDASRCPADDGRGRPRPYGAGCDIGAFERTDVEPTPPPTPTPPPLPEWTPFPTAGPPTTETPTPTETPSGTQPTPTREATATPGAGWSAFLPRCARAVPAR